MKRLLIFLFALLVLGGLALLARGWQTADVQHGAGGQLHQLYPDMRLTPGAAFPGISAADVCAKGYASRTRAVTEATKAAVLRTYSLTSGKGYEIDHLISLELGGTNDAANLWPEPLEPRPGAHEKDWLEGRLHRDVCAGRLTLKAAQQEIAGDWYTVYRTLRK